MSIVVDGISKYFGNFQALRDISQMQNEIITLQMIMDDIEKQAK